MWWLFLWKLKVRHPQWLFILVFVAICGIYCVLEVFTGKYRVSNTITCIIKVSFTSKQSVTGYVTFNSTIFYHILARRHPLLPISNPFSHCFPHHPPIYTDLYHKRHSKISMFNMYRGFIHPFIISTRRQPHLLNYYNCTIPLLFFT